MQVGDHRYWVPFASRLETIASRLEAIAIGFLSRLEPFLVGWRPSLLGSFC